MEPHEIQTDLLIIGSGNAGFSAALSAVESGATSVLLIDKCPQSWAGGNTYFTAGAFRTVHNGLSDLLDIVNNVNEETARIVDIPEYSNQAFLGDMERVTDGRCNKELARVLVEDSLETVKWLKKLGVRFQLSFNRQAYLVEGRWKFWGGLHIKTQDGGKGLVEDYLTVAKKRGIKVQFDTAGKKILINKDTGAVEGLLVEQDGKEQVIKCKVIVMAAGGFEADPKLRELHLGPGWDKARVRGTPHNTGDLLNIAVRDVKAKQVGDWAGCHSVAWDANADPNSGDREISNEFTKSGYPLGLMLNRDGRRFVDEGVDLRNYTYAKFGRAIMQQPDGVAFQVFDSKTIPMLRDEEYREEIVDRITAESLEELAQKCKKVGLSDPQTFTHTISSYNEAVQVDRASNPNMTFDPSIKDGLSTQGLELPKSNWALPLDTPPFLAVKVACGITFTFGGLTVDPETANVISEASNEKIEGLFCVGEMMGGLFYGNYPGGSGLTSGAVFGRRAGRGAATLIGSG